jgi:hypothetical protein
MWEHGPDSLVKMPGSVISLFSELDEFQAALREETVDATTVTEDREPTWVLAFRSLCRRIPVPLGRTPPTLIRPAE